MSTDGSALGYAELLRLATAKGLQELDTMIVRSADQNHGHAVVVACVRTSAALYRAVGEAWWESTTTEQRTQALVLAEVRAKTRALCEAVGMPQLVADVHRDVLPAVPGPAVRGAPTSPGASASRPPETAAPATHRIEAAAARPEPPADEAGEPRPATSRGVAAQASRPVPPQPAVAPLSVPDVEAEVACICGERGAGGVVVAGTTPTVAAGPPGGAPCSVHQRRAGSGYPAEAPADDAAYRRLEAGRTQRGRCAGQAGFIFPARVQSSAGGGHAHGGTASGATISVRPGAALAGTRRGWDVCRELRTRGRRRSCFDVQFVHHVDHVRYAGGYVDGVVAIVIGLDLTA